MKHRNRIPSLRLRAWFCVLRAVLTVSDWCASPWAWFFYGILAGASLGAVGILVALRVVHHVAIPWSSLHWAIARSAVIVGIALLCFGLSMSRMKKKARGG